MRIDRYQHLLARAQRDCDLNLNDPSDRAVLDVCLDKEEAEELLQLHDELFTLGDGRWPYNDAT